MLIVLNKPGRLGNRLRVGAMFMAFSLGHDVPVVNLAFDEYAQYFTGPCRDLFCSIPPRSSFFASSTPVRHSLYKVGSKVPGLLCRMDRRWRVAPVIRLGWHEVCDLGATAFVDFVRSRRIILVQGWHFVDELSLLTYGPHIRAYFTPRDPYLSRAQRLVSHARAHADSLIGVHIRRGDYRSAYGGRFFYSSSEYRRAIDRVAGLSRKRCAFLICSDEPLDLAEFTDHPVYSGTGHFVEDMHALSECDCILGPPSTYSAWSSFYGETPVYYGSPTAPFRVEDFRVVHNLWPPATQALQPHVSGGGQITPWQLPEWSYRQT